MSDGPTDSRNDGVTIVKIGGALLDDVAGVESLLERFAAIDGAKILVHGGGPQADRMLHALGSEPRKEEGRRITDDAALDVAVMVYAGLNGKRIVAALQRLGCDAIGLSGADANVLRAVRRPVGAIDYGAVGDLEEGAVNVERLHGLIASGLVPVLNAITHDGAGNLLNTNADTIAAVVAAALAPAALAPAAPVDLLFVMERPGLLADPGDDASVIAHVDPDAIARLQAEGIISGGMTPKITNALAALRAGVRSVRIGDGEMLRDRTAGTTITLDGAAVRSEEGGR